MLQKILWITLILAPFPSLAPSQTDLAVKGGVGSVHSRVDRHRLLAGIQTATNIQKGRHMSMSLNGSVEFSYQWWDDVQWDDESAWAIASLVDVFPEVRINLDSVVQPFFGAGVTVGVGRETITIRGRAYDKYGHDLGIHQSKNVYRDLKYGFNVQPGFRLLMERISFKAAVKYRYFLDDVRYEWRWDNQERITASEDYVGQSIDLILSMGGVLGNHLLEGGLQAENWVFKWEGREEWPRWPEDWEYMLFAKIHLGR